MFYYSSRRKLVMEKMIHELLTMAAHIIWLETKKKFEHMEAYDGCIVRFGNNEPCCIKGEGCISLTNELVCGNVC